MAIKPILFNSDMVRAILDGRKTVTRRVIKDFVPNNALWGYTAFTPKGHISCRGDNGKEYGEKFYKLPYQIDDILYVRESYAAWSRTEGTIPTLHYKADEEDLPDVKWKPSIHMPKEAARIFLRVTNVSVAKLQDITEEEAVKEGVTRLYDDLTAAEYDIFIRTVSKDKDVLKKQNEWGFTNYLWHGNCGLKKISPRKIDNWTYQYSSYDSARDSFSSLWESTVSCKDEDKYSWDANPRVWVIEFERTEKPEKFA